MIAIDELLVITEYCKYGTLRNYLKKHRKDFIDQIDPDKGIVVSEIATKSDKLNSETDQKNGADNLAFEKDNSDQSATENHFPKGT